MTTAQKQSAKRTKNQPHLVNRKPFGTTLDIKLQEDFDALAEQTRIPKSRLMDEAVQLLLQKHNKAM